MERERFDFTPSRDFGRQDDPSDESFDAIRARTQAILQSAAQVAHSAVTALTENTMQQLRQQGGQ